ncbi:hypothetical protein LLH00_19175 [bacterium]|nr:hypothetical protein [bacterium]
MPTLQVETLRFDFAASVIAEKYDDWNHYRNVWTKKVVDPKAMDVVAVESQVNPVRGLTTWLIEAKDYRILTVEPPLKKISNLPQTVADKARDTLTGLTDAASNASVPSEKLHAIKAVNTAAKRIVFHLEPYVGSGPGARLFLANTAANILGKLKQLVKDIDPKPLVLNIENTPAADVPWSVA